MQLSRDQEAYTLSADDALHGLNLGVSIAWGGVLLFIGQQASNIIKILADHAAEGIFGMMLSMVLCTGLISFAMFSSRPSQIWRGTSYVWLFHILGFLLIGLQALDVIHHALLIVDLKTNDGPTSPFWTDKMRAYPTSHLLKLSGIGLAFSALGLIAVAWYYLSFQRVMKIHRERGIGMGVPIAWLGGIS